MKRLRVIMSTVATLLVFFTVVAASHEYGHLIVARMLGVKTSVFSIGVGPRLATWRHNSMDYALSLLPLGAYVDFPAEKDATSFTGSSFDKSAPRTRFFIALAGPLTNVFLVWLAFFFYRVVGAPQRGTLIVEVEGSSPAHMAGVQPGEYISSVNGKDVRTWSDIYREVNAAPSAMIVLTLASGAISRCLEIRAEERTETDRLSNKEYSKRYLGINPSPKKIRLSFSLWRSVVYANKEFKELVHQLALNIREAVKGRMSAEEALGSPILLVQLITAFIRKGKSPYVLFPVLNLSVAVVNFLPVPMLDGGHMALALFQAAFPFQITKFAAHWLTATGMGFLIVVFSYAIKADIKRIAKSKKQDNKRPTIEVSGFTI